MAREKLFSVGIIGGGPAGCTCGYFLKDFCNITIFEYTFPLRTLLPTGGGRCNLAHSEFELKELAKNYPRGEKFLYSVFSKFATSETLEMFEKMGIKIYCQDDGRIFPVSDSAKDVRDKFLNTLDTVKFKKERVLRVDRNQNLKIVTDCGAYDFDKVIVATGGHSGYNIAKYLGINVIEPKPSLTGFITKEDFSKLAGVSLKDVYSNNFGQGDILFTHKGVSGPLIYKISSIKARDDFPYNLDFKITGEFDLQKYLNENPHKSISNLISEFVPKSFAKFILESLKIASDMKCFEINGKLRDSIYNKLMHFGCSVKGTVPDGETVTSGGVDLNELNPKTMESKKVRNLYFIGEVVDIDGFCGGFNLQNCWSTGYIAAQSIIEQADSM